MSSKHVYMSWTAYFHQITTNLINKNTSGLHVLKTFWNTHNLWFSWPKWASELLPTFRVRLSLSSSMYLIVCPVKSISNCAPLKSRRMLYQWDNTTKKTPSQCVGLEQTGPHHHFIDNYLFSQWYNWKIAELTLMIFFIAKLTVHSSMISEWKSVDNSSPHFRAC
jgi:hypothetical protein